MNEDKILVEEDRQQEGVVQEDVVEAPVEENSVVASGLEEGQDSSSETAETPVAVEDVAEEDLAGEDAAEEASPAPSEGGEEPAEAPEVSAEEVETDEDGFKVIPYHERYYLRYGEGKRTAEMDLAGTRAFLQAAGFDGGELRQARMGKGFSEAFKNADNSSNNQLVCSYCGGEVSGVDFNRLNDGRIRCTNCSNSVVKTKAEVEELCQRVIDNLDNFFGANIEVPVSIEVLDERKLKKKIGVPLGTRDDMSILILGVAISKKKKYKILLENGAPRISLIATFAHELTHIWQYTHWDAKKGFKTCPKDKRLLIYEGMAKWAEIQYLYLIGETAVAKREELITRNRQDEYGVGFRLYEDAYPLSREAMMCEETPFAAEGYPIGE